MGYSDLKTLVLDKQYQPHRFVNYRDLVKYLVNDKVDIVSVWDRKLKIFGENYPAIVRLKNYIEKPYTNNYYREKLIFKRDQYICQYTGVKLSKSELSIDHIIPKSRGGGDSWENCVTCARYLNLFKGNRTPEEAGLKLIRKPKAPKRMVYIDYILIYDRHPDWWDYFPSVEE